MNIKFDTYHCSVVTRAIRIGALCAFTAVLMVGCGGSGGGWDGAVENTVANDDSSSNNESQSGDASTLLDVSDTAIIFKADTPQFDHKYGEAVASSADGNTIVVTEPVSSSGFGHRIGVAYIYEKISDAWQLDQVVWDAETLYFGGTAALTPDGRRLVVGAPNTWGNSYRHPHLHFVSNSDMGAAVVFDKTDSGEWELNKTILVEEQPLSGENFADSLAISADGKTIVAGAPGRRCGLVNSEEDLEQCATRSGAIYIITEDNDGNWSSPQVIRPDPIGQNYSFGSRIAMDAEASTIAVTLGGAVQILVRDSRGDYSPEDALLSIEDNDLEQSFGAAIALSDDGNLLFVGSTYNTYSEAILLQYVGFTDLPYRGSLSVFERVDGKWGAVQVIKPPIQDQSRWHRFGAGIASALNGSRIAVGMSYAASAIHSSGDVGAAFVFDRVDGEYQPVAWAQPTHYSGSEFGLSLGLSADGRQLTGGAVDGSYPGSGANLTGSNTERVVRSGDAYVLDLPEFSQ